MTSGWRLRQRLVALLAVLVVALVAQGVAAGLALRQRDGIDTTINTRLAPARLAVERLGKAYVDQESGERGFLISGQPEFLAPYRFGLADAADALTTLRSCLAGRPALLVEVDEVEQAAQRWRAQAAEPEIAAGRRGEPSGTGGASPQRAKALFDELRRLHGDLQRSVQSELDSAYAQSSRAASRLSAVVIAGVVLGLVAALVFTVMLLRWVLRPVDALSRSVRRVADGHLDEQVPVTGPAELGQLGADVEAMRRRLLAESASAMRARQALDQGGLAVATLSGELAPTPGAPPAGLTVVGRARPAEGVLAGDWYDVVALPDGQCALVVTDVSGHGPVAGIVALRAKQLLLAALREGRSAGMSLGFLADTLEIPEDSFLTCLVVVVEPVSGAGHYASAGHPPAYLVPPGGPGGGHNSPVPMPPTGPLLGPLPGVWQDRPVTLEPGWRLVAYTDGVTEARAPAGEEFGERRLLGLVRTAGDLETAADAVLRAVDAHTAGSVAGRGDDVTLVLVERRLVAAAGTVPPAPAAAGVAGVAPTMPAQTMPAPWSEPAPQVTEPAPQVTEPAST